MNRRHLILGAGVTLAGSTLKAQTTTPRATAVAGSSASARPIAPAPTPDQVRRLKWWREARYGLFIHYGLYSLHGRQEWAVEKEAIPWPVYEQLANQYSPKSEAAKEWVRIAQAAGARYMVVTAKRHEGFCNFDTRLTNFNSMKQGPKRDLVREYVEAARAANMRVGLYYSLMDWHHPDGERSSVDEAARQRFIRYTFGLIEELMTNYGKIDILWYDGGMPLDAAGWEAERMNDMVFRLQPDIVVNGRNRAVGDFSTPEQSIIASPNGRSWESCMTLNESWGYDPADDEWKSPRTHLRNLITCARDQGNFLINVGPKPDGSFPDAAIETLSIVGDWLKRNGESIFLTDRCQPWRPSYAMFTRRGNTLFMHVHFWPGKDVSLSGLQTKVKSVHLMIHTSELQFSQDKWRVHITGLPIEPPDHPVTTIVIECESEPLMNTDHDLRLAKPRGRVNMSQGS